MTGVMFCGGDVSIDGVLYNDFYITLIPEVGLQDFYVTAFQGGQIAAEQEFETWGTLVSSTPNPVMGYTTDVFTFVPMFGAPGSPESFGSPTAGPSGLVAPGGAASGSAVAAVPELSAWWLVLTGILLLGLTRSSKAGS
jgi:hypothetical protein